MVLVVFENGLPMAELCQSCTKSQAPNTCAPNFNIAVHSSDLPSVVGIELNVPLVVRTL